MAEVRDRAAAPAWNEVERRLDAALELTAGDRSAFLNDACSGDPELRHELERLLAACDRTSGFLHSPAVAFAAPLIVPRSAPAIGTRVGPYRIVRELAHGGMGTVYFAERADGQFDQQVALKLIRGGFASRELDRRFMAERRILARLNHPNVAKLLDGGLTAEGQPWFAMEYVDGLPITRHCDAAQLGVSTRLTLFADVCDAVRYAHQNLVVHRDLKPSNILVDRAGRVKLLDFGIAKLLDEQTGAMGEHRDETRTGMQAMTPEYAAPEQVRSEPITTATDVYALGAVLYELLTGRRAQVFERRTAAEVERVVCEVVPGPPHVSADLDTIILKALHKAPLRRYPSAEALLDDLRRYQAGLPVTARPPSRRYRGWMFIRRHRTAVAAGLALALALTGGLVTTTWQARVARQEARKSQAITEFVWRLFEISYPEQARGRQVTARELLDEGARRVETELAGQPELQASLLHVIGAVYRDLAIYPKADTLLRRATELSQAAFGEHHIEVVNRGGTWGNVLYHQGDYARAESVYRHLLPIVRDLKGDDPQVSTTVLNLAYTRRALGDYAGAEELFREALAITRRFNAEPSIAVAFDLNGLGAMLLAEGKLAAADSALTDALRMRRRLMDENHEDVLISLHNVAALRAAQGNAVVAESLFRQVLVRRRRRYPDGHPFLAATLHELAGVMVQRGARLPAESLLVEALGMRERILGSHMETFRSRAALAALRFPAGPPSAILEIRAAADSAAVRFGPDHPFIGDLLHLLGSALASREQCDKAREPLTRALLIRRRHLDPSSPQIRETDSTLTACRAS
jgi:serine/threonine-protein kinase